MEIMQMTKQYGDSAEFMADAPRMAADGWQVKARHEPPAEAGVTVRPESVTVLYVKSKA